jgi:hypothetical protein
MCNNIASGIKSMLDRIKVALRSVSGDRNELRLALGFSRAFLVQGKALSCRLVGKSTIVGYESRLFWKKRRKQIVLRPSREPNSHIVIVGMSGFGKSTLLKSMLYDISSCGVPAILFDAHDEHEAMVESLNGSVHDSSCSSINIFDIGAGSVSLRISELTNLFKTVYSLGYVQAMKLSQCLWYMYRKSGARGKESTTLTRTPTIKELIGELDVFIGNSRTPSERNTLLHLKGRLSLLDSAAFSKGFVNIGDLRHGINSFSLGSMRSEEVRLIYISELLRRLYQEMKGNEKEHGIGMYIVIDEAQFLISSSGSGSSIISQLIGEGRKYGVGVILATHTASDLDRQIIANAATFISFYSREPSDVNYIANVLSGGMPDRAFAIKSRLHQLRESEAIMISGRYRDPVLLETPNVSEVLRRMEAKARNAGTERPSSCCPAGRLRELARRPVRLEQVKGELCGLDASGLSSNGIEGIEIKWEGVEEQWLMARNGSASIEHEVYVTKISEYLTKRGIKNAIIDNSRGPDLVAYLNGDRVAIEYETGRKLIEETVSMLNSRLRDYGKVLVLVNDDHADAYLKSLSGRGILVFPISRIASAIDAIQRAGTDRTNPPRCEPCH